MRGMLKVFKLLSAPLLMAAMIISTTARSEAPPPNRVDIADAISMYADAVSRGSVQATATLRRLGPDVDATLTALSGLGPANLTLSAESQIHALYMLAENGQTNEGRRFLGKLHSELAKTSAAAATDPDLLAITKTYAPGSLAPPIQFASVSTLTEAAQEKPLPVDVAKAIDLMADYSSPRGVGGLARTLRKAGLNVEDKLRDITVARHGDSKAAQRALFALHAPPPKIADVATRALLDSARSSAALALDPALNDILANLARESLPENLARYSANVESLPSHVAQVQRLGPNAIDRMRARDGAAFVQTMVNTIAANGVEAAVQAMPEEFTDRREKHASYSAESMEPRAPQSGGGGGGGEPGKIRPHVKVEGPPVSRTYKTAIFSARAARGVAVGAELKANATPMKAFWIPSIQDPLFGRFVVLTSDDGIQKLAASRFMFADSFEAAISTLWSKFGPEADYREGEITIVMSLDPNSDVSEKAIAELEAEYGPRLEKLRQQIARPDEMDLLQRIEALTLLGEVDEARARLPRGIVTHPALVGKQLAWAAARVDFWFYDLMRACQEAETISGTPSDAVECADIGQTGASTWQFYERDSSVSIQGSEPAMLKVGSGALGSGDFSSPNHFAVTLFALGEDPQRLLAERVEEGVYRLPSEEIAVQPVLDWLFVSHPDFMQLNDYSESLSILRWLGRASVQVAVMDPDGPEAALPTPDRIYSNRVDPSAGE